MSQLHGLFVALDKSAKSKNTEKMKHVYGTIFKWDALSSFCLWATRKEEEGKKNANTYRHNKTQHNETHPKCFAVLPSIIYFILRRWIHYPFGCVEWYDVDDDNGKYNTWYFLAIFLQTVCLSFRQTNFITPKDENKKQTQGGAINRQNSKTNWKNNRSNSKDLYSHHHYGMLFFRCRSFNAAKRGKEKENNWSNRWQGTHWSRNSIEVTRVCWFRCT